MSLYLDTAYIAKCYLNEPDAQSVRALVRGRVGLSSSAFCTVELACVFQRHLREGGLNASQAARLHRLFRNDLRSGVWRLLPISTPLLDEVERQVRGLPASVYLRAADALHLTSAAVLGFGEVWTNDRHLLAAAPHFGVAGRSV